jgi:hypothetical protein
MSLAYKVLDRLEGVRPTGDGRWIARCAGHDDSSPSLSIRELPNGILLLRCFAGCETLLVLQAIGLDFGDLYDKPLAHHFPPIRGGFNARELLALNANEVMVASLILSDARGRALTPAESTRLAQAAARLITAQAMVQ